MLVLSRKAGESIRIGTEIEVVVLGVSKGRVRLGFELPQDIPVRRSEIIHRESGFQNREEANQLLEAVGAAG